MWHFDVHARYLPLALPPLLVMTLLVMTKAAGAVAVAASVAAPAALVITSRDHEQRGQRSSENFFLLVLPVFYPTCW